MMALLACRLNNSSSPPDDPSNASDLEALYALVARLSSLSPVRDTATSELINGRWALLYTSSSGRGERRRPASFSEGSREGALALPFVQAISDEAYKFFYR